MATSKPTTTPTKSVAATECIHAADEKAIGSRFATS